MIKDTEVYIISWYNFSKNAKVQCVEDSFSHFSEYLGARGVAASSVSSAQAMDEHYVLDNLHTFDYLIAVGILERCNQVEFVLQQWGRLLKNTGVLLLGMASRLGIQFFCGDRDPFTGNIFDSIENYAMQFGSAQDAGTGRLYARAEMIQMLEHTGFGRHKFYSVWPNLAVPQLLYAEGVLPNEDLALRITPRYNDNTAIFMNERYLYDTLVRNGLFHELANAYFIECPKQSGFSPVEHVTLPVFRDSEAFATLIREDGFVEKRILDDSGIRKLEIFQANDKDLKSHGIKTIPFKVVGNSFIMPYIDAPSAVYYLRNLLQLNKDKFVAEMDRFMELIVHSSGHVSGAGYDAVLEHGYIDLVPINAFFTDGDFLFYDQEFCYDNLPARVIIWRSVDFIYAGRPDFESILPEQFFFTRYNIKNPSGLARKYIEPFMRTLLNTDTFEKFNDMSAQDIGTIGRNRQLLNVGLPNLMSPELSPETCFDNPAGKKIVVFGSGKYADKLLAFYKDELDVYAVIDNATAKQGQRIRGILVEPPSVLQEMEPDEYKVIICMRNFSAVYMQLKKMGVRNIGLYDADYVYPNRRVPNPYGDLAGGQKQYHIGYIAGVFDLYHLGHLNMFRRAKDLCDYLIVGVTSDRYVRESKKREPFIPFEERLEIVRSCRYVDEAHEIPFEYGGTVDAFCKYHFDVQFSGSDYMNNSWWLEQKAWLEKHGAELVFFSYTQQTSSTKIKALIDKGLL